MWVIEGVNKTTASPTHLSGWYCDVNMLWGANRPSLLSNLNVFSHYSVCSRQIVSLLLFFCSDPYVKITFVGCFAKPSENVTLVRKKVISMCVVHACAVFFVISHFEWFWRVLFEPGELHSVALCVVTPTMIKNYLFHTTFPLSASKQFTSDLLRVLYNRTVWKACSMKRFLSIWCHCFLSTPIYGRLRVNIYQLLRCVISFPI